MPEESEVLIRVSNLTKLYLADEVETHALSEVSLTIEKGEFVSITGPSGCGKSTLLSILGLLDTATSGTYSLNSLDVSKLGNSRRAQIRNREIGFVFQSFNLIGDLTVRQNVELPLTYQNRNSAERKQRVMEVLERVGMSHRTAHFPAQLSGGQQQRVAVARALVTEPAILLADEPTGNLDSQSGDSVMDLLSALHSDGATICMVTHNTQYTDRATRTIRLMDGMIASPVEDEPVEIVQ